MPVTASADLPEATSVLIAGGGPVGLAAAIELGRRGVECLIVEPRDVVSHARPRCKTVNVRSMEHLRRWGLADRLRARAPLPVSWSQDVVFCTTLAGHELSRFTGVLGLVPEEDRFPELGQQAPQYVLEEVLREAVEELEACTFATPMIVSDVVQDDDGVRVAVRDHDGRTAAVGAHFVIGCDGPRSTVRQQIGAAYQGDHALRPNFGMVFQAPGLWRHVRHGRAVHYWIINPEAPALMGPIDTRDTWWIIAFGVDRETGERDALRLIDAAAGVPTGAQVLSTDPWTARMQVVDRMRVGRVFLAGDAAHLNPPFGGHGLNTGIGDAVDLGWKLAAVLDDWGGPALLDSYSIERRPIQERVIREATANMAVTSPELLTSHLQDEDAVGVRARHAASERIQATKRQEFHALDLVLDVEIKGSPAIVYSADGPPGVRPGALLRHHWCPDRRSLYDVLGDDFTLLVRSGTPDVGAWADAARARQMPLRILDLRDRAETGPDLALVRPDRHVAWVGDSGPGEVLDVARGATPLAVS